MAAVATLKAMLGLDTKAYKASMKDARKSADSLKRNLAGAGAALGASFSLVGIVAGIKHLTNFATEIVHVSENLGISTNEFQALNAVALKHGVELEMLRDRMGKLAVVQGRVRDGQVAYNDALKTLNIDAAKFANVNPARAFEMLAIGIAGAKDETEALSALSKIYSEENAPRLISALKEIGTEGLDTLVAKSKFASDEALKNFESMGTSIAGTWNNVTNAFIEGLHQIKLAASDIKDFAVGPVKGQPGFTNEELAEKDPFAGLEERTGLEHLDKAVDKHKEANDAIIAETEKLASARLKGEEKVEAAFKAAESRILDDIVAQHKAGNEEGKRLLADRLRALRQHNEQRKQEEKTAAFVARNQARTDAREAIRQEEQDLLEKKQTIQGRGVQISSLAGVGGAIGPSRGVGIAAADRQLKIAAESAATQKRIEEIEERQTEILQNIDYNTGGGLPAP